MGPVIYGTSLLSISLQAPGFRNDANKWYTISISQVYTTGIVGGIAFAAYSAKGVTKIWWDNMDFHKCARAFAAVDASGYATGLADDFWVYWDDLAFSYYACDPLPKGWIASGDAFFRGLVSGGIAYVANYTGGYRYSFYLFNGGWQLQFHCL